MSDTDQSEAAPTSRRADRLGRGWGSLLRLKTDFVAQPIWLRWLIGVPAVLLAIAIALAFVDMAAAAGRIHPGVRVGSVDVGGLTVERARQEVESELATRLSEPVAVSFDGQTWLVESADVSATLDPQAHADDAYELGRRGSVWRRIRERVTLWLSGGLVVPYVSVEDTATRTLIEGFDEEIGIEPTDATVSIDGTEVAVVPSAVGRAVDRDGAIRELVAAFVSDDREVELPTRLVPVSVTDADAQVAADDARLMLGGPLTLEYEDKEWAIEPLALAEWIGFQTVPYVTEEATSSTSPSAGVGSSESTSVGLPGRMVLEAYLMATEVSATVSPLAIGVGKTARDASFSVSNGVVTIVPAEVGLGVDIAGLTQTLERVLRKEEPSARSAVLRMQAVQPELTTEEAQAMGINDRLATYTTNFASTNAPRVNNIQTLAKALDGTLLAPGESFSFNDTIGPRTAEKGYQEAGTIVNGQLVPTLGGGICQVCTTLFNSVFFSGLPIDQRSNHSFYISSYPTGRDASVSWGGPDFKFTNDTSAWLLIATGWSSSSVTISIYGTDPGYEVDYTTGAWTDVRPFPSKEIKDNSLDEGIRVVEASGVDGRTIVVTRTVRKNGTVVREDTFRSKYNAKEEIVRVGTRSVPGSSAGTATSD